MRQVDVLVIGSGPAGQRAAIQCAKLGRSVAIVERNSMLGGVCINTGTIPSKALREAILSPAECYKVAALNGSNKLRLLQQEEVEFNAA